MRKIVCLVLSLILSTGVLTVNAKIGDVIGTAFNTDIVAYINNWAIPSYAVNGQSVIIAEDLRNFGFSVKWNGDDRTLNITGVTDIIVSEMDFAKAAKTGSKFADVLETDIKVYADGHKISSYAINGYTMIPIEELDMFGSCVWVPEERAIKLWLDELHMRDTKQIIDTKVIGSPCADKFFTGESGMGFSVNSADGITLLWVGKNNSGKTINYYTLYYSLYNPVGDPAYDEITNSNVVKSKFVGPVPPDEYLIEYDIIAYSNVCYKVILDKIYLEYSDGTTEWVDYGYEAYETLLF